MDLHNGEEEGSYPDEVEQSSLFYLSLTPVISILAEQCFGDMRTYILNHAVRIPFKHIPTWTCTAWCISLSTLHCILKLHNTIKTML